LDASQALLGPLLGFSNNMGMAYVAERVGTQKFPIPRNMATGAIVQTTLYFTDANCTSQPFVPAATTPNGAYFVSGYHVYRAGGNEQTLTISASSNALSGVCTAAVLGSVLVVPSSMYTGVVNFSQAPGALFLSYP
jgi:hypothetical protein